MPGGDITHASASHRTPYGLAASTWRIADGKITLDVEVPANCDATIHLPGRDDAPIEVGSGKYTWSYAYSAPETTLPPLTLDSTIEELIDHQVAYDLVMETIERDHLDFKNMIEGQPTVTLRQAIGLSPSGQGLQASLTRVLEEMAG